MSEKQKMQIEKNQYLRFEQAWALKEWLMSDCYNRVKNVMETNPKKFVEREFVRNPLRQTRRNRKFVKCFADGILLYQGRYRANQKILEIKGKKYTVKDILMDNTIPKDKPFYVAGTYLTTYSVHIVRCPIDGIVVDIDYLPPLTSSNLPMVLFENNILSGKFVADFLFYNFYNERTVITIYSPVLKTRYYVVLIADADVDKNLLFVQEGESVLQGQRLAYVLWGSQCDLIIEAKDWFKMKKLVKDFYYVFAGTCDLWEIMKVNKK